jgi:hypothetical protein
MASERARRISRFGDDAGYRFSDWVGTVGLAQDISRGPRLEANAGLDRERWLVVAMNVDLDREDPRFTRVSVDAVDLQALDVDSVSGGFLDILAAANGHGSLPVTRIELAGATLADVLQHMTGGHMRVTVTGLDAELDVVATRQHHFSAADSAQRSP